MFLKVDIKSVCIEENALKICEIKTPLNIEICDLIGCRLCEEPPSFLSSLFGSSPYLSIRYISKGENYRWTAETVQVTGSKEECGALENRINDKIGQEKNRPKKLGVFINPIGGNQSSLSIYSSVISPLFKEANISCDVLVTERSKHMIDLANSFDTTSVDGLVVMGGDGTLLEVFNTLLTRVQKEANLDYDQPTCKLKPLEIPIGIIPTGTGNGVAKGLYGNIDVVTAALHIIRGRTRYNNVQALYTGGKLASFSSVIVAVGLFSEMMFHTERQRWMKKARYVFVPLHLLLFKKQRLFNAKLTIYHKNRNSLDGAEPTEWEDAVQLEGKRLWGVVSFSGDHTQAGDGEGNYVAMLRNGPQNSDFSLLVYSEFEKDFLSAYTVHGYKVKIINDDEALDPNSEEAEISRILDVDGELVTFEDGEYEVWNHLQVLKFYTSI
ncbi:ceramide kinase-like isoform X4 [Crassostrea virginica]|uniref:Ceramide kinase-like isoform X4 n=1 Tax=Crassostrea virginica TaxID=6565 RepID=A0A8B8ED25_CRAVI|nr:ceramide kinase-like isoform X4 [Crassostrea virginica]